MEARCVLSELCDHRTQRRTVGESHINPVVAVV